ncbi:MBL fold metallo-hydrolase [Patulibacter americanus]|uniref:MBL fold metallo-hydrolase n=1 Tax=Patulibacter americanus TaxID=588672 RepID=UPI0003B423E5|nr:MBL fold metallo-hydrolase [Patulibacter americanus]
MADLVVERIEIPAFVGNSYVVGFPGGPCAFVDAGADAAKMMEAAARHGMTPAAVLLTHHHYDHVSELEEILDRVGRVDVMIHAFEQPLAEEFVTGFTQNIEDGEVIRIGDDLELKAVATPGHTAGMLSFVGHGHVFTGDTLFRESVAGVRAPGHTTFEDLRSSIMDTLLELPDETVVVSGHNRPSTIGHEREHNPFVRVWRGLDPEGDAPVIVSLPDDDGITQEHDVRLVLEAADYDGGTKCWIRWPDGADDLVPGSKVRRP